MSGRVHGLRLTSPSTPVPIKTVTYPSWFMVYEPVFRVLGPDWSPVRHEFSILNPYRAYLQWWQ